MSKLTYLEVLNWIVTRCQEERDPSRSREYQRFLDQAIQLVNVNSKEELAALSLVTSLNFETELSENRVQEIREAGHISILTGVYLKSFPEFRLILQNLQVSDVKENFGSAWVKIRLDRLNQDKLEALIEHLCEIGLTLEDFTEAFIEALCAEKQKQAICVLIRHHIFNPAFFFKKGLYLYFNRVLPILEALNQYAQKELAETPFIPEVIVGRARKGDVESLDFLIQNKIYELHEDAINPFDLMDALFLSGHFFRYRELFTLKLEHIRERNYTELVIRKDKSDPVAVLKYFRELGLEIEDMKKVVDLAARCMLTTVLDYFQEQGLTKESMFEIVSSSKAKISPKQKYVIQKYFNT